jgi:hypothetical protein
MAFCLRCLPVKTRDPARGFFSFIWEILLDSLSQLSLREEPNFLKELFLKKAWHFFRGFGKPGDDQHCKK